jgi:hypothetical protein
MNTNWEEQWDAKWKFRRAQTEDSIEEYFTSVVSVLYPLLKTYNVVRVEADFYGGGDSGECQGIGIQFKDTEEKIMWNCKKECGDMPGTISIKSREVAIDDNFVCSWVYTETEKTDTLDSLVEDISHRLMVDSDIDWYNNEGGGGEFRITLQDDGTYKTSLWIWQNVTETVDALNWNTDE